MKQVTATGQTVEEAVESALAQLNTTKDRTEITIIDEGKKGIFGIFGSRPAIIKATVKIDAIEEAKSFLLQVSEKMGVPIQIEIQREGKQVNFTLTGDKIALLIGKRGQTLNSLQYLTQLVVNRFSDQYLTVILDAEDYRKRRSDTLVILAQRLAQKALKSGKSVTLEPMPSYERKVIHTALVGNKRVKTFSDGSEPHRHIVITPVKS
ncbi:MULTISPECIES: RNA-binding cell elongation regulator Jag/EloR [unclassified Bacillus (in: firmicutes)]|uniref:RNA-binding cell elongation regulator Jag/EloR n=1 Tax=unclassified Bacillus (in: firmicutes) TaxID=185979 RepID=UPI0008EBF063|nr:MULTISPECIES: RNA-binding cell elongation regulator Jag/EloR [unclassified Bacillus (in: firmicutes)]SFB01676.1 spoIIIJ-associated protein [Bacillus sp. UNCCL13]SFQ89294.1 spoIIIJ-associated protein [Bacillus sp. cl95]